ncbi:hypothetical protein T265_05509 [Opisthorchis viverrini]|uniref:SUI1 domain-containing protein n=1 Tax=Opisthorchis viverrini TaxID=6198 RepID=A0A075AF90_OPIVI|nr:hypothetical protein T265_05509 [Opisthorchis viverrini]KER27479.1 hypothetical protein T265_05509 [Opisthorchis viverrini]
MACLTRLLEPDDMHSGDPVCCRQCSVRWFQSFGRALVKDKRQGIELKVASKVFGQKFATGSSVTGNGDEIVIQGDVKDEIIDLLTEKWPEVYAKRAHLALTQKLVGPPIKTSSSNAYRLVLLTLTYVKEESRGTCLNILNNVFLRLLFNNQRGLRSSVIFKLKPFSADHLIMQRFRILRNASSFSVSPKADFLKKVGTSFPEDAKSILTPCGSHDSVLFLLGRTSRHPHELSGQCSYIILFTEAGRSLICLRKMRIPEKSAQQKPRNHL